MIRILICPTEHAETVAREWRPARIVGFAAPGERAAALTGTRDGAKRLDLVFNDVAAGGSGLVPPGGDDIAALLAFGADGAEAQTILVHCRMGISRSSAAALILAAQARPQADEAKLAENLRIAHPCATPNPLMIALADDRLGRNGHLIAAARSIGRGADYRPYRVVSLELPATA